MFFSFKYTQISVQRKLLSFTYLICKPSNPTPVDPRRRRRRIDVLWTFKQRRVSTGKPTVFLTTALP